MIISASRRTDIPAFYSEWFFNRVKAGSLDVTNPFNRKQVSRISLKPEDVDCIVFWTKDAAPMIDRLNDLAQYKFYFQFTITPYDEDVEPGLLKSQKKVDIIHTFQKLSDRIGKDKIIWRYDPILLNDKYTIDEHIKRFNLMFKILAPYTNRCIISFLDLYKKTEHNTKPLVIKDISVDEMKMIAKEISKIAEGSGIEIKTCSEKIDLSEFGISHSACIDKEVIEKIIGYKIQVNKDKNQRQECGCVTSVDIGQYDTCPHLCAYCYANFRPKIVQANFKSHDKESSALKILKGDEVIKDRKVDHLKINC